MSALKLVSCQELCGDDGYKPSLEAQLREARARAENAEEFARLQQADRDRWAQQLKAEAAELANETIQEALDSGATAPADDPFETPVTESPLKIVEASEFAGGAYVEPEWSVEELIPAQGIGLAWGLSGSHKTGGIFDLLACVHRGVPWRDKAVKQGRAVLVVGEGEYFFGGRMRAYAQDRGIDVAQLPAVVPSPINLGDNKQVAAFAKELKKLGAAQVWFDTLQQCAPGLDENSVKDMGGVITNLKWLAKEIKGFCGCVHHAGKSVDKGPRGSSAWRPAVDVELYFESDGTNGTMRVEKLKDAAPNGVYPFTRKVIELGTRANGKPITSVVVAQSDQAAVVKAAPRPLGGNQKLAHDALVQLALVGERAEMADVIDAAVRRKGVDVGDVKEKDERRNMRRALVTLQEQGRCVIDGRYVSQSQLIKGGSNEAF